MPDEDYPRCHYSISCGTDDLAVLHCLRSLSQYAEGSNIPQSLPWGGTGEGMATQPERRFIQVHVARVSSSVRCRSVTLAPSSLVARGRSER